MGADVDWSDVERNNEVRRKVGSCHLVVPRALRDCFYAQFITRYGLTSDENAHKYREQIADDAPDAGQWFSLGTLGTREA